MEPDGRNIQNDGQKQKKATTSEMETTTAKEGGDDNDTSAKMATMESVCSKQDKCLNFTEKIKHFHGHKYSRWYNLKIVLKEMQDNPDVFLAQCFQIFLKKMVVVDPCFMILPWKENLDKNPLPSQTRSQKPLVT